MTYIDQLRQLFREGAANGFYDWDLIEEIKKLARMRKMMRTLQKVL